MVKQRVIGQIVIALAVFGLGQLALAQSQDAEVNKIICETIGKGGSNVAVTIAHADSLNLAAVRMNISAKGMQTKLFGGVARLAKLADDSTELHFDHDGGGHIHLTLATVEQPEGRALTGLGVADLKGLANLEPQYQLTNCAGVLK